MRLFGPNILAMQKKKDVQGLMQALGGSKAEIAREALVALIGMGLAPDLLTAACRQKAWPLWLAVRRRLDDPIPTDYIRTDGKSWKRSSDGSALCRYSGSFVQPLLLALLEGPAEVKAAALETLQKLDRGLLDPPGAAALTQAAKSLLRAPDALARGGAVAILDAADWRPEPDAFGFFFWLEKGDAGSLAGLGGAAVEPLIAVLAESLRAKNWIRAVTAAKALGELGDARAAEVLTSGLASQACSKCVEDLRKIGLSGSYRGVRCCLCSECVEALGKIDGSAAEEALVAALKKGLVPAGDVLTQALRRKGPSMVTRVSQFAGTLGRDSKRIVITLCAEAGEQDALRNIIPLVLDRDVKADAIAALKRRAFQPADDEASLEYCVETGDFEHCAEAGEKAVPVLAKRLRGADDAQRDALLCTLIRIGEPSCGELARLLNETSDTQLEQAIVDALVDIGRAPAVAVFAQMLRDGTKVALAIRALDSIGFEPANDDAGAAYYEQKGNWRACLETGPAGVQRTLAILLGGDRRGVCSALSAMPREPLEPLIAGLEKALENPVHVLAAAAALDALGWTPRLDGVGARYWIAKQNFEKCSEVGAPAFDPLVNKLQTAGDGDAARLLDVLGSIPNPAGIAVIAEYLKNPSRQARVAAGRAILRLYRSCPLTEQQQLEILQLRSVVTQPHADGIQRHVDVRHHYDRTTYADPSDCSTRVFSAHTDGVLREGGKHKDNAIHMDEGIGLDFPV